MQRLLTAIDTGVALNCTVHPASTKTLTDISGNDDKSGMRYAFCASGGKDGRFNSPLWVAYIMAPFGFDTGMRDTRTHSLRSVALIGTK